MDGEVKLMMTWDILPGREEDYFEFHVRQFIPALEEMGLILHEAWLTVYGKYPRLMAEAVISSYPRARKVLESESWHTLGNHMKDYADNFEYKLIPSRTRWQM